MNKFYVLFFSIFVFIFQKSSAQGGIWTWIKGDSTINNGVQWGNYGIQGVPSPANEPPGRYNPSYWKDQQGNFWLFGGQIYNLGQLNDLWKYEPGTNIWTWMKGAQLISNTGGVFGVQGVPDVNNYPSSGGLSGYNWTDANNNLWLYHSWGDIWRYSIANNEWTWMKGQGVFNQAQVLGIQGVSSPTNSPGAHTEYKCCWTDAFDNLWMYLDGDVWKYDITSNEWTWMKGPGSGMPTPNFGTQGVPSSTNQPGLGQCWEFWQDRNGYFYMAHGAYNSSALWRFDPVSLMWTWMNGIDLISGNATGASYISRCVPSSDRYPGKRIEGRGAFHINANACEDYLWFCGGNSFGMFNDLWCYKPTQNTWTWVAGDSVGGSTTSFGNYGVKGVPSSTNELPRRQGHAMWVDSLQQVWVFGGIVRGGVSRGNDLWRFTPEPTCIGFEVDTTQILPPSDLLICKNESTSMTLDPSWTVNIQPNANYSCNSDTSLITFFPPSTTTYTIIVSKLINNCPVFKNISFTITVEEYFMPSFPNSMICEGQSTTISVDTSYQFTFLPSAFSYNMGSDVAIFNPNVTTTYTVTATKNGCPVSDSANFQIVVNKIPHADFIVSPNLVDIADAQFYLFNQSSDALSYQWFVDELLIDTTLDATYLASDTGKICFKLIAINQGCIDSVIHCGEVLSGGYVFIPNAFSPNGDLLNDGFQVIGRDIQLKTFMIYNRWGQQLFRTSDINKAWNGQYKGEDCEVGVYFYYVEFTNKFGKQFIRKGDVTLLR
jgi:gliding motility-associated-like protein